ncbi:hypothetical protein GCM10009839_00440 [Catenulispora yoronensis]|uniref:2'-5' RNA ligase n=1 Tax=Catenulispora yoronensis TaxID=450799 RepID=A0ABP5EZK7_9ACTN
MLSDEALAAKFDDLFERGRRAVLTGTHQIDVPPTDDGRWGISVVLRPDPRSASRLAQVTGELMERAGRRHWPTGSVNSVHFTVRALEPYRAVVPVDDERVARYRAALSAAAARSHPMELRLRGGKIQRPADGAGATGRRGVRRRLPEP